MTALAVNPDQSMAIAVPADHLGSRMMRSGRIVYGGGFLLLLVALCLVTLPLTTSEGSIWYFNGQHVDLARRPPAGGAVGWFGFDNLGRSMLSRCLLGGTCSLAIGLAAASISVVLGITVGLIAGYRGGWIDSLLMRIVDILYGLPYILMVILLKIALETPLQKAIGMQKANFAVLFLAIGAVSWLTMARVVRGQVLSLRAQPFIEACTAAGLPEWRIFLMHLLPNLVGPITVYATLIVPSAILEESFLSFLGIGIQPPMPTWGSLASEGLMLALNPIVPRWWMLFFPCLLLASTLLCLNYLGDGLRDIFDPKSGASKL